MSALLIGAAERLAIAKVILMANAFPVNVQDLIQQLKTPHGETAHRMQMTVQSVELPVGYLVCYSIEDGHGAGRCRHLSISGPKPDQLPSPEAAWLIAEEFGFVGNLLQCAMWLEDLMQGRAMNLVQPISVEDAQGCP